jgi:hypothetical protein
MIHDRFLLLKFFGCIGLTGLSEISFFTMAWRLGIRGEKMKKREDEDELWKKERN